MTPKQIKEVLTKLQPADRFNPYDAKIRQNTLAAVIELLMDDDFDGIKDMDGKLLVLLMFDERHMYHTYLIQYGLLIEIENALEIEDKTSYEAIEQVESVV